MSRNIARLPPLLLGDRASRLPLSEPSAAAVLGLLIDAASERAAAELVEALTLDPALALYVALEHASLAPAEISSPTISELAAWFALAALSLFRAADSAALSAEETAEQSAEQSIDRQKLAASAAAAVTEAEAVARGEDAANSPAYLQALLQSLLRAAPQWIALGGGPADITPALPGWLGRLDFAPQKVARASRQNAAGKASKRKPAVAVRNSRAAAARARWLVPAGFASTNFYALTGQLARAVDLKANFAARLEEEKLAALGEFAAGAGHEINNPLAVISGRAQLFMRHEQDPERRRELAVINTQARRVYEMIADLMLFARPPAPRFTECSTTDVVATVVAELSPRAADTGIEITSRCAADLPTIAADATQLMVALRAVIENSLDWTDSGGRIEICCERCKSPGLFHSGNPAPYQGGQQFQSPPLQGGERGGVDSHNTAIASERATSVAITIRDNGPGMPPEVRRHAFDPYFSGRGAGRGLGLGLSKCWRIVAAHHGRVDIDTSNAGTTVTMLLPVGHALRA